jgi:hypothetical protein
MSLMPSVDEMHKLFKHLDTAYKGEMVLYQLHSILFWTSILEITLFFLLFITFCAAAGTMGGIWFHLPHVIRGVVGFILILKHLPKSHEIIEFIDLSGKDVNKSIDSVSH